MRPASDCVSMSHERIECVYDFAFSPVSFRAAMHMTEHLAVLVRRAAIRPGRDMIGVLRVGLAVLRYLGG